MSSNGRREDRWSNSIRFAAHYVLNFALPLHKEVEDQGRLLLALEGDTLKELDFVENLQKFLPLRQMGQLGWDPEKDLFIYTATGSAEQFGRHANMGPNKHISRTISFSDEVARPIAVVTMMCLIVPGRPNEWELRSLTLYGLDDEGCAIERPILISPVGLAMIAPVA